MPARRNSLIFVVSAPSGAGKTTLVKGLLKLFPKIRLSVSCTTRRRRAGEKSGRDYYFVEQDRFMAMRRRGDFAEWANVHGSFYGTPWRPLERNLRNGYDVLLDIDVAGFRKIKRRYPAAVSVFLLPPSWRELERRLARRKTDGKNVIRQRLKNARRELQESRRYDYLIVNREIRDALESLKSIVRAERLRVTRIGR
ncbi:MAG: guanylate kinase [Deltaproteobacteria bacterium]|nr:guanylate kinase [Deltaproteobacteria bacterium]